MDIVFALILAFVGLLLCASFSGSETGFYRIPRVRLKLDVLEKDRTARRLLWFVNRPSFFIATLLVGNNVAHYMVSLATVFFVEALFPDNQGIAVEILSTLLVAPFLFVYGEMFPKYLFMHAPNRMLRKFTPVIMFFFWLFLPFSSLLWLLNKGTSRLLHRSREMIRLALGRDELTRMIDEGHDVGILVDAQQRLANGVFAVSNRQVKDWAISATLWPPLTADRTPDAALEIARRYRLAELPVYEASDEPPSSDEIPLGYVRTVDLEFAVRGFYGEAAPELLQLLKTRLPIRGLVEISSQHTLLTAMILLQTLHGSFGCVIGDNRRCVGFVSTDQLREVILNSESGEINLDVPAGKSHNSGV
jgi:CBS domain containing-hemolysin-like protein